MLGRLRTKDWRSWLGDRRWPMIVAALAVVVTLPSLGAGWLVDDHHIRLRFQTPSAFPEIHESPILSLFKFADGVPENNHQLMDIGFWPWWTLPTLKGAFLRPVTAISHWLDHVLWPDSAALMHLQSLLWYGAAIFASAVLYRRFLGKTWVAGLAALLYAIDDAHCIPAAWMANRNALIAVLFGLLTLLMHDQWRRRGWMLGGVLGPLFLLLSLLSKEAGVATCGYLAAYAVFLDRGSWRNGLIALWPYVAVAIAWRVAWAAWGYGVSPGFMIYVDPLHEPIRFLVAVGKHAPIYLAAQLLLPPADTFVIASWFNVEWLLSLAAVAVLIPVLAGLVRYLNWDPVTKFFGAGTLLSLLPVCTALPGDRMLMFVGIGACALVALYVDAVWPKSEDTTGSRVAALVRQKGGRLALVLLIVHAFIAPLALLVRSAMPLGPPSLIEQAYVNLPDDLDLSDKTVVVLSAPIPLVAAYLPERRALDGLTIPAHTRILGPSFREHVSVSRPDARTLVLEVPGGLTQSPFSGLARSRRYPMRVGQMVILAGMAAEVHAVTEDGLPSTVAFTFDVPLEDRSLVWLHSTEDGFARFTPPKIGASIHVGPQSERRAADHSATTSITSPSPDT